MRPTICLDNRDLWPWPRSVRRPTLRPSLEVMPVGTTTSSSAWPASTWPKQVIEGVEVQRWLSSRRLHRASRRKRRGRLARVSVIGYGRHDEHACRRCGRRHRGGHHEGRSTPGRLLQRAVAEAVVASQRQHRELLPAADQASSPQRFRGGTPDAADDPRRGAGTAFTGLGVRLLLFHPRHHFTGTASTRFTEMPVSLVNLSNWDSYQVARPSAL